MVFLHWVALFFHTTFFKLILVQVSTQVHLSPPFIHDGALGVISHHKSLVECRLEHGILLSLSFIAQNEWQKLAINSWSFHFLSCSTSPVDNAHIPLYYEYLKFLPAVCRLYNHILCLISFHFHFQSLKVRAEWAPGAWECESLYWLEMPEITICVWWPPDESVFCQLMYSKYFWIFSLLIMRVT